MASIAKSVEQKKWNVQIQNAAEIELELQETAELLRQLVSAVHLFHKNISDSIQTLAHQNVLRAEQSKKQIICPHKFSVSVSQ